MCPRDTAVSYFIVSDDLFLISCILAALWAGELLFEIYDNVEHLGLIKKIVESFPNSMVAFSRQNAPSASSSAPIPSLLDSVPLTIVTVTAVTDRIGWFST